MDLLLLLVKGEQRAIFQAISTLSLPAIERSLNDFSFLNMEIDPDIADMILDVMKERFNYHDNEYPFINAAYILKRPRRIDEFVLPNTDKSYLWMIKSTYK